MGKRKKTSQETIYDGTHATPVPILKVNSTGKRSNIYQESSQGTSINVVKRPRLLSVPEENILANFNIVMHNCIASKITSVIKATKEKDVSKKLDDLKLKSMSDKRLPLGIITDTAKASNCSPSVLSAYLDRNLPVKNNIAWNQYAKDHFDDIAKNILSKHTATTEPPPAVNQSQSVKIINRTCSTSLNKIIRADLPDDVRNAFMNTLQETMTETSSYIANFSEVVFLSMLLFKEGGLVPKDGKIVYDNAVEGLNLSKVLPEGFIFTGTQSIGPPPLSSSTFSVDNANEVDSLFDEAHLSLIHSNFFGSRGVTQDSLEKHVVNNSLSQALSSFGINRDTYKNDTQLSSVEMSIARSTYMTNLKVMWDKKKLFNSMVNHLLDVLLRLHLAPKRERKYKEMKEASKKHSMKKRQEIHEKGSSRNKVRNLVRAEWKNLKKYQTKSDETKIKVSQKRIAFFKRMRQKQSASLSEPDTFPVLDISHESDSIEDLELNEPKSFETDISRKRLLTLKLIIKDILFSKENGNIEDLVKYRCNDISTEELYVTSLIIKSLAPYIPLKEASFRIAHQLPFVLLANALFEATGYQKFMRNICPMPSLHLNALRMDGPALYHMLTRKKENSLHIFDYDGYIIDSEEFSRRHQDEVFGSVFNMKTINEICGSSKLKFSRSITFVPGLTTVRLLGEKRSFEISPPTKEKSSYLKVLNNPVIVKELDKDEVVIKEEIDNLQKEINTLTNQLRNLLKEKATIDYSKQKKDLKLQWRSSLDTIHKTNTFTKIQEVKQLEYEVFNKITRTRTQLQSQKKLQYVKRMAIRRSNLLKTTYGRDSLSEGKEDPSQLFDLASSDHVVIKTEDAYINKEAITNNNTLFSGTDNGIVTMTNTVGVTLDRFKFHLELYNKYEALSATDNEHFMDDVLKKYNNKEDGHSDFLNLPTCKKILATDIDVETEHRKARRKLEKKKKCTDHGKRILQIEQTLSESPLNSNLPVKDAHRNYVLQSQYREEINQFYFSKDQARSKRSVEIQDKKFRYKLCTKERAFIKKQEGFLGRKKPKLIMMIGNRGTGVGSRIKGHLRYGGKWKQDIHGKSTQVCITNENNTSQTCVFCYNKLIHPIQTKKTKEKYIRIQNKGSFRYVNPRCVSVKYKKAIMSRDTLSALAIGLSGMAQLLFQRTFPAFSTSISQSNTNFNNYTSSFFIERERLGSDDVTTRIRGA